MERVFATLELRSIDDEAREFTGIANSGFLDFHRTVVDPNGAVYKLPIPLFFHVMGEHGRDPIGEVFETWVKDGLRWVRGRLPCIPDDGTAGGRSVKDRVDAAWADIKNKLVRGLSIDFVILERKGSRISKWQWVGLSVVPLPSNQDASIMAVRSAFLAASGDPAVRSPGVSGTPTPNQRHGKMTIQEQITQHENSRAAKVAQRDALLEKSAEEGRTLDSAESETFDTLDTEIRSIDEHLVRLASAQKDIEKRATPVDGTSTAKALESRSGVPAVSVQARIKPGLGFARYVMSLANSAGSPDVAAMYAKRTWGDDANEIVTHLQHNSQTRAAIAAGTTLDATFAAPLVQTNFLNEFLELLRPATLIGRIPGLKRVPFNISLPAQTAGGTYNWVGQGAAKPLTNMAFSTITLGMAKAAGIIVLTQELVRSSAPSAQELTRDELIKGITVFLDDQFVDPAVAAVANVSPASITNGVAGDAASGVTAAAARTDFGTLLGGFVTGNFGLGQITLLMNEGVAFTLGLMQVDGTAAFPSILPTGGTLLGMPVVTSNVIADDIFAVHTPSILVADDGGVDIAVSTEASLQMDSAPANPTIDTTVLVSMFQRNLVALRGERYINWAKARATAVRRINTVAYAA